MQRPIRAVFFDAVGTLIHPEPSAAETYARVARKHGSTQSVEEVAQRFAVAWQWQEWIDRQNDHRTNEERERQRWRAIVDESLEVDDQEACFTELWEHFSHPSAWRCEADAGNTIAALRQLGFVIGVASNFDARLHGVACGLPELEGIREVTISSEVGWKKPHPDFFRCLCAKVGMEPGEILMVGDDLDNDFQGARTAGLRALLLDPWRRAEVAEEDRVERLLEVLQRLG